MDLRTVERDIEEYGESLDEATRARAQAAAEMEAEAVEGARKSSAAHEGHEEDEVEDEDADEEKDAEGPAETGGGGALASALHDGAERELREMTQRAARTVAFKYVRLDGVSVFLSYKSDTILGAEDFDRLRIRVPHLVYSNRTSTAERLLLRIRHDVVVSLLSQFGQNLPTLVSNKLRLPAMARRVHVAAAAAVAAASSSPHDTAASGEMPSGGDQVEEGGAERLKEEGEEVAEEEQDEASGEAAAAGEEEPAPAAAASGVDEEQSGSSLVGVSKSDEEPPSAGERTSPEAETGVAAAAQDSGPPILRNMSETSRVMAYGSPAAAADAAAAELVGSTQKRSQRRSWGLGALRSAIKSRKPKSKGRATLLLGGDSPGKAEGAGAAPQSPATGQGAATPMGQEHEGRPRRGDESGGGKERDSQEDFRSLFEELSHAKPDASDAGGQDGEAL